MATRKKQPESAATAAPTDEEIGRRAHEISESSESGSDDQNWLRAERELSGSSPDESLSQSSQIGRLAQTGGTPESGVEPGNEPNQE